MGVRDWTQRRAVCEPACWSHLFLQKATLPCKSCRWAFPKSFFLPLLCSTLWLQGCWTSRFTLIMSPSLRELSSPSWAVHGSDVRCFPKQMGPFYFKGFTASHSWELGRWNKEWLDFRGIFSCQGELHFNPLKSQKNKGMCTRRIGIVLMSRDRSNLPCSSREGQAFKDAFVGNCP